MGRTKWPEEVPVLGEDDICRGRRDGVGGTHCLLGWGDECGIAHMPSWKSAILSSARQLRANHSASIICVNDSTSNSKRLVARIWNRAMAKLGYTVNNPEAKYLKAKK